MKSLKFLALAAFLGLSGCYKATVTFEGGSPGAEQRVKVHSLIAGLVSLNEIDGNKVCGDKGVWSVSSRHNVIDMLLGGLTGGIYTPVTVLVTCKG